MSPGFSSSANAPSCQTRRSASGSSSTSPSAHCPRPSTIPPLGSRPSTASATFWPSPAARWTPTGLRVVFQRYGPGQAEAAELRRSLVLSLTEIIRYGADAPQVTRRLYAMLDELQATLPGAAGRHSPPAKPAGSRGQRRVARPVRARGLGGRPGGPRLKQDTSRPAAPNRLEEANPSASPSTPDNSQFRKILPSGNILLIVDVIRYHVL